MEFELNEEQKALQKAIKDFADGELAPGAAQRDASGEFPAQAIKKLQEMGVFGLIFPPQYGGGGRDFVSYVAAVEELARVDASVTITLLSTPCARPTWTLSPRTSKRSATFRRCCEAKRWGRGHFRNRTPAAMPEGSNRLLFPTTKGGGSPAGNTSSATAPVRVSWW